MKQIFSHLALYSGILMATCTVAEQHQHHSSSPLVKDCENPKQQQRCAKTMSSIFDKNGRLWSAWTNDQFLYVNFSDDDGMHFSIPVRVNSTAENISARNEHRPKIKISKNGNIYLSWTTKLQKRFTGHIRFSASTDGGRTFSKPVTINDNQDIISHRFDALGVNNSGHIYISWLDKRDQAAAKKAGGKYNGAAAYYAISTDNGKHFSHNKKIADSSCECCRMAISFDKNDLPVIAWRHIYNDNIRDHAIVSFESSNQPSSPQRMTHDQWYVKGCPHHGPSLDVDDQNRYHAVWFNNAEKRHGIFYAYSDSKGKAFSTPVTVGNYDNRASHADVITSNNNVYLVWKEFDAPYHKILMMKSDDRGEHWLKPEEIAKTTNNADYPFLIQSQKNVYVSWHIPGTQYQLIPIDKKE